MVGRLFVSGRTVDPVDPVDELVEGRPYCAHDPVELRPEADMPGRPARNEFTRTENEDIESR